MKVNLKKIGFVGGVIATGVAFKWACDATARAVVMSQKDIAGQRSEEEKYFFEECKKLEDEYETLLAREEDRANILFSDSKAAYRKAKEAADIVTDREMTMWNNGKAELQKEIEQLTEAVNVILREEQIRANDILKEDSAYQMLQEARKVLVEGEKSTDEIDRKIAERAAAIKDGIESLRSDETARTIRIKDLAIERMANYDKQMDNIVAGRSQADKDAIAAYKTATDNLLDKKKAKKIVVNNRSDADVDLIQKYDDAQLRKKSILAQERIAIDPRAALGKYLKANGYSKGEVIAISLIPVVPVACAGVAYGQWVHEVVKNME